GVGLFLADGTEDETVESLDESEFESLLRRRGTNLVCVVFKTPDVVDDQLYPQLRKTRRSLVDELGRLGFDVVRSREAATEDRCLVLVEMNVGEQSNVEKHAGPPVHVGEHAERFRSKYADSQVTGPYIEDGRYVVEREREFTTVGEFVRSEEFLEIGMGKHVGEKIEEGYEVIENGDCARLLDDFGTEFEDYFRPELGPR
ncbi:MAG: tRNA CCA-pyrophosphorylase, partial [Halobacteria archaeon]|nr:tRNA CCA-pyrophosphorylase [Halobacteria archaeon]